MPFVFSPLSLGVLSKVRILLETLGAVDVGLLEVNGGSSVGSEGRFDVADGAGGWKQSNQTENAAGTSWTGIYNGVWTLFSAAGGEVNVGESSIANQPSFLNLRARGSIRGAILGATNFLLSSTTTTTLLTGRLLSWDGTQNVYLAPNSAVHRAVSTNVNEVITTAQVQGYWRSYMCEVGGLTMTLPNASAVPDCRISFKDMNGLAGASPITIQDAGPLWTLNVNFGWVVLQSDGTNWRIMEQS